MPKLEFRVHGATRMERQLPETPEYLQGVFDTLAALSAIAGTLPYRIVVEIGGSRD